MRSFLIRSLRPLRRRVEQVLAIDDARLADELPGGDLVGGHRPNGPALGNPESGRRHRMRRHVELGAGVAVHHQDVAVVGAERADLLVVVDLERRERSARCRDSPGRPAATGRRTAEDSSPAACGLAAGRWSVTNNTASAAKLGAEGIAVQGCLALGFGRCHERPPPSRSLVDGIARSHVHRPGWPPGCRFSRRGYACAERMLKKSLRTLSGGSATARTFLPFRRPAGRNLPGTLVSAARLTAKTHGGCIAIRRGR